MKQKSKLVGLLSLSLLVLTACGTSQVTEKSPDLWEKFVYFFAETIRFLSFNASTGVGIILFTILIRTVLLPVFQYQMNSTRKMQEAQPLINALKDKYPGRDLDSRNRLAEETQRVYKELGIRPMASVFLPLLVQMPVLLALYQALTRVDFLKTGHFLWLNLAQTDPYYVLPVLAAVLTFLSSWLSSKAVAERTGMTKAMSLVLPVMIFVFALNVASGVALYWVVSNAYQVFQTLILSNPFKIIAEREAKLAAERELEAKKKRALKKARKKKK